VIEAVTIVAALALGIAALVSMRKYGRRGILWRAIVGVALNGLVLAAAATLLVPMMGASRTKGQVAGRWTMQSSPHAPPGKTVVTFNADGTFAMDVADGATPIVALSGRWTMDATRVIGITVDRVTTGNAEIAGKSMGLGRVTSVDAQRLVLKADAGDETYERTP